MQDFHYSVSLHISHPDIAPELITQELGLQPTRRPTCKGEAKTTPNGTPREGYWEFSHWWHRFEIIQDGEWVVFPERLVGTLEPHRAFLRRIVGEEDTVECFVGLFTDTNCDQILPFGLMGKLADLRMDLRLDLYGSKLKQAEHSTWDGKGNRTSPSPDRGQ